MATRWIFQDAVLHAVEDVARGEHGGVDDRELGGWNLLASSLWDTCSIQIIAAFSGPVVGGAPATMPSKSWG